MRSTQTWVVSEDYLVMFLVPREELSLSQQGPEKQMLVRKQMPKGETCPGWPLPGNIFTHVAVQKTPGLF